MERFDVVVVGAGPAGATAARAAAEGGARTLLLDRRPELGHPVQCGEFVPAPEELADLLGCPEAVAAAFSIPPETVLARTRTMSCVAPDGRRFRFPLRGFTVSRRAFDKRLALDAEGAGAELRHPVGVLGVRSDELRLAGGGRLSARVIVAADGPLSTVARSVGFTVRRRMYRMITASAPRADPEEIALYFGSTAPGGYAWVIPRADDANVGLGVDRLPPGQTLSGLLDAFAGGLGLGRPEQRTRWWVPIGPPPQSAVRGTVLFAGDAANLVMATNGGGIPTAMISGHDAGTVAAAHVRDGSALAAYDRRWHDHLFAPLQRGHRIKRLGDRVVHHDRLLSLAMYYIGANGLDRVMRLRWPWAGGGAA